MTGPTAAAAALGGLCPRCGARTLYSGLVRLAPRCRSCDLDFDAFNVGDGPAAFLILIVGAIVTAAAIVTELKAEPPFWVHLVWIPATALLTLTGLRLAKAWLLFQEYRHSAREGRIVR